MTEWDLTYILLGKTREEILGRVTKWNKRCEQEEREYESEAPDSSLRQ